MVKKHIIDTDENTWGEVQKYKIDMKAKKVNDAVMDLIKKGLEYVKKNGGKK